MKEDAQKRMEKALDAIKKAGEERVGEKLARKSQRKKKQKKTRYPSETRWFRLKERRGT